MIVRVSICALCTIATLCLAPTASAAEGGQTPFLKGYRDTLMGLVPPAPGLYFRNDVLYYSGELDRTVLGGRVEVGVDAASFAEIPSITWVSSKKILGGQYAVSAFTSLTDVDIEVRASSAFGTAQRRDTKTGIGDSGFVPIVLGWHGQNNTHWNAGVGVVLPTGAYNKEDLANTSLNRWAVFYQGGFTYFDPQSGIDLSIGAAYVVSFENEATDYNSGDMVQMDMSATRGFGRWRAGVVGYTMWQVTDDSGAGARLGDFRSQVYAAGPLVGYNAGSETAPINLMLKWSVEWNADNAPEGDTVTAVASMKF